MADEYKSMEVLIREREVHALLRDSIFPINLLPLQTTASLDIDIRDPVCYSGLQAANDHSTLSYSLPDHFKVPSWMEESPKILGFRHFPGVYFLPSLMSQSTILEELDNAIKVYPFEDRTTNNVCPASHMPPNPFDNKPKMRWVSLGCIYDWSERAIITTGKLPAALEQRSKDVANLIQSATPCDPNEIEAHYKRTQPWSTFLPDCALVNYYEKGERLRGHTDNVEESVEMPLITFSFGQPAFFLIGGLTRDVRPTCIVIREGDVMVLSGPSRHIYHGVPRLLGYTPNQAQPDFSGNPHKQLLTSDFRKRFRVNISVRQT